MVGGAGVRGRGTKRRNWSVRTAVCECMALYLRELRKVLVTLAREAKNSDNAPKGYPGGAAGPAVPSLQNRKRAPIARHRHCYGRSQSKFPILPRQSGVQPPVP